MFISLIIGSVPELFKKANSKKGFKYSFLIYLLASFGLGIFLVFMENKFNFSKNNISQFSFIYLIISGFFMSAGVIIPGVSSTLILMLMGIYDAYLISVSSLYIPFLLPLGVGLLIGSICCMKFIKILLDKYYSQTFYCIIGFTLGSVFVLAPNISSVTDAILGFLGLLLGFSFILIPFGDNS